MDAWVETLQEAAVSLDSAPQQPVEQTAEQEFEQRLTDCSALAYRVALGVLHIPADAEEVAQEAFVRAYRHFTSLREPDKFQAWLVRVTWRLAIDRQRSAARRDRREQVAVANQLPSSTVEEAALSREFETRLNRAVDSLPEKLRRAVILSAIEGYDMSETAALLALPEGTVRSRLHRARKLLAEKLR
ncbi:MAG TPA: sigma-70 family RNA polymerase sigma factor [Terriglobia bacterium]